MISIFQRIMLANSKISNHLAPCPLRLASCDLNPYLTTITVPVLVKSFLPIAYTILYT